MKSKARRRQTPKIRERVRRTIADIHKLADSLDRTGRLPPGTAVRTYTRATPVEVREPQPYTATDVKALRDRIGASQPTFAEMLAVSVQLVRHWEQGLRSPAPVVCRLFDLIARNPEGYAKLVTRNA